MNLALIASRLRTTSLPQDAITSPNRPAATTAWNFGLPVPLMRHPSQRRSLVLFAPWNIYITCARYQNTYTNGTSILSSRRGP